MDTLLCDSPVNPINYLNDGMPSDNSVTDLLLNSLQPYSEKVSVTEAFFSGGYPLSIFII